MPHHRFLYREICRIAADGTGSEYCTSSLHDAQVSEDSIPAIIEKFVGIEGLQSIHLFGKALPAILRGEVDLLNTPNEAGSLEGLSRAV